MISFWLLCWKLLRATTGLRRTPGELTDGNEDDDDSSNGNPSNSNQEPITMEISSSPPLLMDLERENLQNYKENEEEEPHYPEVQEAHRPISNEQEENCDYLVFEIGKKKERKADDCWFNDVDSKEEEEEDEAETSSQSELLCHPRGEDGVQSEPIFRSDTQQVWGQEGPRDDLSDCLQAELAAVYSDSDTGDDQWAASSLNGDVISQSGRETQDDSLIDKSSVDVDQEEVQSVKHGGEQERCDSREQMASRRDMFLRGSSTSSTASSSDPERKLPSDFSVQQDSQSDNVSSEHVDFMLARQQWKKMEQEVKGRPIPKPGLRAQGSFQGTHTSLYPPTRSPRLKHREIQPAVPREAPLSSTLSPGSEDSGLDDSSYRSPLEEPESAVEREIRLTLEREEKHRRERGLIEKGITVSRPSCLQTSRSPPRPPACRTPTLSVSPSCSSSLPSSLSTSLPSSLARNYHELTASNVIILEPDSSPASRSRLISTATGGLSEWSGSSANVVVVETSNLIIRSASEFCLNSAPSAPEIQESTFTSNPFFKLRSLSSQSLVEREIRVVRQREEEWRRQRDEMFKTRREKYHTVLVSPGLSDNISITVPEVSDRSVSSPSSPSRTRKMERSSLSCDLKFPSSLSSVPKRQNAMAQRWEASLLANQKKD